MTAGAGAGLPLAVGGRDVNLLLLEPGEIRNGQALIGGPRALHLLRVLQVRPGSVVRLGLVGDRQGKGEVLQVGEAEVRLQVTLGGPLPAPPLVELILALPRPIMLRRILKQATVLGVRRLHLIRARRVEKSYFASPVLAADTIRALLLEAMAQAVDTWLPEVHIHRQFKPFIEDVLPELPGQGLVAHPGVAANLAGVFPSSSPVCPIRLAVGPEGGWSDYELAAFVERGCSAFSMGSRILHVDTAVVALLAQIALLVQLREKR